MISMSLVTLVIVLLHSFLVYLEIASKELWRVRENRVLYALGNCLLNAKVSFLSGFTVLYKICYVKLLVLWSQTVY